MRITLFCAGGMSTEMFVKKIIKAGEKRGFTDVECSAYGLSELKEQAPGSDIILLGPQIGFQEKKVKEVIKDIPIAVINMTDYGLMNGNNVFEMILKTLGL